MDTWRSYISVKKNLYSSYLSGQKLLLTVLIILALLSYFTQYLSVFLSVLCVMLVKPNVQLQDCVVSLRSKQSHLVSIFWCDTKSLDKIRRLVYETTVLTLSRASRRSNSWSQFRYQTVASWYRHAKYRYALGSLLVMPGWPLWLFYVSFEAVIIIKTMAAKIQYFLKLTDQKLQGVVKDLMPTRLFRNK